MNKEKQLKAYWHIYHDRLFNFSDDINERIEYIKRCKSSIEVPLRLRLLKEIRGTLPEEIVKAGKAWWRAYNTYNDEYLSPMRREEPLLRAAQAFNKADIELSETLQKYCIEIEALHKKECLDCPWDGRTIFPRKKEN